MDEPGRYVIKDPLTTQYVALSGVEFRLLAALDGTTPVSKLLEQLRSELGDPQLRVQELSDLLNQFLTARLIVAEAGNARRSAGLSGAVVRSPARGAFARLAGLSRQLVSARIRLFDPSALLLWLRPVSTVVFSRLGAIVWLTVCGIAGLVGVVRFGRLIADVPTPEAWLAPELLLPGLLAFVVIKSLHELSHAAMADRWGAECREAGVLLFLLAPVPYTNVTDTWMIDRRKRMLVACAGVLAELFIAAVCLLLWSTAAPGVARSLLAGIVLLCSATTLLFNANPLVRFDGYFLLADAVNRPNLAQQAAGAVQSGLERWLLGPLPASSNFQQPTRTPGSGQGGLLVFGLLSAAYRMILAVTIGTIVLRAFSRWGLPGLGWLAMVFVAAPLVARPVATATGGILAGAFQRLHPGRALLRAGMIGALILVLFWIPLPRSIVVPAVVEPAGTAIFALQPSTLLQSANYGESLEKNSPVATTDSVELRHQLLLATDDVARLQRRVELLTLQRDEHATGQLPETREALAAAEAQREQWQTEIERLTLSAGTAGTLLPPRAVDAVDEQLDLQLPRWSGLPLSPVNSGARLEPGTLLGFCTPRAGTTHGSGVVLTLCLTADDRRELQPGQSVLFQPTGSPGQRITGKLQAVSPVEAAAVPTELLTAGLVVASAGDIPAVARRDWRAQATLPQVDAGSALPLYSTGLVRIPVAAESLASRLWRGLLATFGG
jgi:putative peptide zinc metalloprotease protein